MKIQHLCKALAYASCFVSVSAFAAINADRSTIRVQANGSEYPTYDTRNIATSADGRFTIESVTNNSTTGSLALTDMQLRQTSYLRNNQGGLIFQWQVFVEMSQSGRYIALRPSSLTNADFGPEKQSLYLYDVDTATMNPVEKSFDGSPLANCQAASDIVSTSLHNWGKDSFAGDKKLFFYSSCSNLVAGDTNGVADIFVYDIAAQTIELVTRNPVTGTSFAGQSVNPRVSKDGSIVAFASRARDIVNFTCHPTFETNYSLYHVYVLNRNTGVYSQVNYCHSARSSVNELAYDVADDGSKVHFLGKDSNNADSLVSLTVKTGATAIIGLKYSSSSPLETNQDGSVILFRSQGYYDDNGVYSATFNGNAPNAYGLFNVNTGAHSLVTKDKTTGALWNGLPQWHATLSPSAHVVTFGTSGSNITNLLTTSNVGEASVYFYLHQPFGKNFKWVTLRGAFNNWKSYAGGMTLVGTNLWEAEITLAASGAFKFDVSGDWSTNYGDNNADGIAGLNESNINISQGAGRYKITFNDATKQYTIKKIVDVKFTCYNGVISQQQHVAIVGNQLELANWAPATAIQLTPGAGFTWSGTVTLPANTNVEWKCIKRDTPYSAGTVVWESGANNQVNTGSSQTADGHF